MGIGAIVCTCGGTIGLDVDRLVEFVKGLEGVEKVKKVEYFCRNPVDVIKELNTERVLFIGCSERSSLKISESGFWNAFEKAGVERGLYEVVNIREQCDWIHDDKEEATRKAMDQILMGYVKLKTNKPIKERIKLEKRVLVVGGGVAGMKCASELAKVGIDVVLVERKPYLGGHAAQIPMLFQCEGWPSLCTSECIVPVLAKEVMESDRVEVLTNAEIVDVEKVDGNFLVTIVQKPVYVDPEKCVSCGKCSEVCPVEVKSEFEMGFGKRKAIDKDFAVAVPDSYNLLEEYCNR